MSESVAPDRAVMLRRIANENLKRAERIVFGLRSFVQADGAIAPYEHIKVNKLVEEMLEDLDLATGPKGGVVRIVGDLGTMFGSRVHVSHVFRNLIANAVLHNSEFEDLVVEVGRRDDGEATFYVRDNGRGIPKDEHETIFQPFRTSSNPKDDGMGLGLALVHSLVSQANGKVRVESDLGCGATFWISWP